MNEMIQVYLYKTIIAFISFKGMIIFFKEQWNQLNPKKNGFIKRNFNTLLPCLIPVFRWIWIAIFIILSFMLFSPEFVKRYNEKKGDK